MTTMNVSLPDTMRAWVETQANSGRYGNASDYVRDLVQQDQDRQMSLMGIQKLVDEGLASGPAELFNPGTFLARRVPLMPDALAEEHWLTPAAAADLDNLDDIWDCTTET